MERSTYPFPLAVNSSHHSHYHRFLLGVEASVLRPFPKPYCVGAIAADFGSLVSGLDLPKWRKLYHAALPWRPGFGTAHYGIGNVPAHRPLPPEYGRPARRFGAYDFVQVADPSLSALALVAGDRRVLERFTRLCDDFCRRIEKGTRAQSPGPSGSRSTGRMLAGQFAEPNNRWLMPFLHVHSRVLNFTSFAEEPGRLACIDSSSLARAAQGENQHWIKFQANALSDLGYRVSLRGERVPRLRVEGVTEKLLAAIEAPRIAILKILERMILGDRPHLQSLTSELPPPVIASMSDQLESMLAGLLSFHRPAKVGIPSEGPWRRAVREHLGCHCPGALLAVDGAAAEAKAALYGEMLVPTPPLDAAHWHTPRAEALEAAEQRPSDPELHATHAETAHPTATWLLKEFTATLADVNERIVRAAPSDPFDPLRATLAEIDQSRLGADATQLRQSRVLLGVEIDRGVRRDMAAERGFWQFDRFPLASLDELFERASEPRMACEREIGGRSL